MEANAQNKTAVARQGLQMRLHMAKQYRRFAERVLPNSGDVVGAIVYQIECEWAITDAKRIR